MLRVNTRVETQGDRTGGEERLNIQLKCPLEDDDVCDDDEPF